MKYLYVFLSIGFLRSSEVYCQHNLDTTVVLPTDIYDNYNHTPLNTTSYLILRSESGKVIFESKIKNNQCSECYTELTNVADSIYQKKDFKTAAMVYGISFRLNGDKGAIKHRLNAACAYANLNDKQSAFRELHRIVFAGKFSNYHLVSSNECFKSLHSDPRWGEILKGLEQNLHEKGGRLPSDIKND